MTFVEDFEEISRTEPPLWQVHERVTGYRQKLLASGFRPLPINGKIPSIAGWQDILATPTIIKKWIEVYPEALNTGVLTATTPAIDIDILFDDAARAVEELARERFEEHGYCLVRFGKPPKRAILLRSDEPFRKLARSFSYPNSDPNHPPKIEILAAGQQIVVAGIHPETGQPYYWHGGREPGQITREQLPYIRDEDAQQFLDDATQLLIKEFGFTTGTKTTSETSKTHGDADSDVPDEEIIDAGWSSLINNIITGHNLHDSIRDLAASLIASGVGAETAERLLLSVMQSSTAPHDERWQQRYEDIHRIVRGARKFGQQQQQQEEVWEDAKQPLPFVNMTRWDDEIPPTREWAVLDKFPLRQTALFSGEGAVGKSIVLLHLCTAHSLARDWLKSLPEPGPALFVDAEDEADELHRRLANILEHYGASFADAIAGGLHIMSLAGHDAVLAAPNRTGKIEPTTLFRRFLEAAGDIKPKMIGIASAANVFAGNESDRSQVQQFISLLTKLAITANGAVILVTHPSHTGINTKTGLSGSTAWHNSVRARCYMKSVETDDDEDEEQQPDSDLREILFKKNNYGPVSASIVLRYRDGLYLPVAGISSLEQAARHAKVDEVFLTVLNHLTAQGQDLGPHRTASNYAPHIIAQSSAAQGIRKAEFEAAQQRLLDANCIHIVTVGPESRQRKYLRPGPAPKPMNSSHDEPC